MKENQNLLPEANSHQVSPQLEATSCQVTDDSRPNGYNHREQIGIEHLDWMDKLADSTCISQISMVGTHDSLAYRGGDVLACQTLPLLTQLEAGIRMLDVRCKNIGGLLPIYHNIQFEGLYFNDVLNTVINFLHTHPSETVVMRVANEGGTANFSEAFSKNYWPSYKEYFWQYTKGNENPTLGEVRGKIVMFQNFDTNCGTFGITWESPIMSIQDDYELKTNWCLYDKWEKVKSHLIKNNKDKSKISINFLSGAVGAFPYFVASGQSSPQNGAPRLLTGKTTPGWKDDWPDFPRVGCFIGICSIAFEGTNNLIINYIRTHSEINHAGIIMCDFPGPDLINTIISLNSGEK